VPALELAARCNALYTAAIADILDRRGWTSQTLSPALAPLRPGMRLAGPVYPIKGRPAPGSDYDGSLRRVLSMLGAVPGRSWDRAFSVAGPILPARLRVRNPGTKVHKVATVLPAADLAETYVALSSHFDDPSLVVRGATEPSTLLRRPGDWPATDPVELMLYLDSMTYLPDDILTKVDRAAMAASLETRVPFLDPAVAELAWRLPLDLKVRAGQGKWVLRQLLERYVPPELTERPKMGFGVPLGTWLRGTLRPWAEELLNTKRLADEGFLDPQPVQALWQRHLSGQSDNEYLLWDVLMFQAWLGAND